MLGSWPLLALASVVAYAACFLPLGVWLTFTAVVVARDRRRGPRAHRRHRALVPLVARRFWVALGVVLLSTLVAYVLATILARFPQLVAGLLPVGCASGR